MKTLKKVLILIIVLLIGSFTSFAQGGGNQEPTRRDTIIREVIQLSYSVNLVQVKKFNPIKQLEPLYYDNAYDFLVDNDDEELGYGLYSYLLFKQEPNRHLKSRYLKIIEAFLEQNNPLVEIQRYAKKHQINISYIPVRKSPPPNFEELSLKKQVDWVFQEYNYARASILIGKIRNRGTLDEGPFIVSYEEYLTDISQLPKGKYLFQDFSGIHKKVAARWVKEFLNQSQKISYWDEEELGKFANKLRDIIAKGAAGIDPVITSVSSWLAKLKDLISFN